MTRRKDDEYMGLISDYLEQCRESMIDCAIDPCMIITEAAKTNIPPLVEIQSTLRAYSQANTHSAKVHLTNKLHAGSKQLETLKTEYLLCEKSVLHLNRSCSFESDLVQDMVMLVLSELKQAYVEICNLQAKITAELGKNKITPDQIRGESEIREEILHFLVASVLANLQESCAPLDTSAFRKVTADMARMIKCFENEEYNQPNKKIVTYYLEKEFKMKPGHIACSNCHQLLLEGLPYCLNCYERN